MKNSPSLASLAGDLANNRTTSRELVEKCLQRIADPDGEGARAFIAFDRAAALATAEAMDELRRQWGVRYPFE